MPIQLGAPDEGRPARPPTGRTLVALALVALPALALAGPARAQAPVASFAYTPESPLSGEPVTFSSTSTGTVTDLAWDLDGDGACDDAVGATATRSFPAAGAYPIRLCVNLDDATQKQTIVVRDRPPLADFGYFPARPTVGDIVTFSSTAIDLDGPIVAYGWDLDGDSAFDDGSAISAALAFGSAGLHRVGLQVLDRDGAAAAVYRQVAVTAPEPVLLSPFPVVRLSVVTIRGGVRVKLLGIRGPSGLRVTVRCHGRDCPWRRRSVRATDGSARFKRLQRRLRAGTVIEVFATRPGQIGKYVRYRIRRGRAPARVDACVAPGAGRPSRCPA